MKQIHFHPNVENDINGSFSWYEKELKGLGLQFISELEQGFDAISYAPSTWVTFEHGFRRYILTRFPFSVVYKEEESAVYVVAVMHNSRNPEYWKDRIQ
ncbi:MAG TPA: type II toxin-antitoxin system RelE/ParE family toxin [Epsilonproteobacteria bacterium]|nr:type II toxin-antitoxin system RelE/ParE family toxin [Campylobacterota bacterium]